MQKGKYSKHHAFFMGCIFISQPMNEVRVGKKKSIFFMGDIHFYLILFKQLLCKRYNSYSIYCKEIHFNSYYIRGKY